MHPPSAITAQPKINAAIAEVVRSLSPDVQYIRPEIAQDWSGDWAVYFRVVLSDEAARSRLREVTAAVRQGLSDHLDFDALGLRSYYNFRTVSEQAALREEAWDAVPR